MLDNKKIIPVCVGMVLALGVGSAQAAMMNFTVMGDIIAGQESSPNIYNLSAGDTVMVSGTFDDSVLANGTGTVFFDINNPLNHFAITLGAFTVHNFDETDYALGNHPSVSFTNYQLLDLDIIAQGFSSFALGFDDAPGGMSGRWRPEVQFSPVPVPAALWLFGSGLIGLAGFMRKK